MNRYHSQYLDLMKQIEQGLDETAPRPSKLKTIIDNLVTASLWNSQGKINWKHPSQSDNVPDGWTILDDTVMLLDGLTERFSDRDLMRKLGFFALNLPENKMHPGPARRWRDMCDRVKKRSTFYAYEASSTYGSKAKMLRAFHSYFLERFGTDNLSL